MGDTGKEERAKNGRALWYAGMAEGG